MEEDKFHWWYWLFFVAIVCIFVFILWYAHVHGIGGKYFEPEIKLRG